MIAAPATRLDPAPIKGTLGQACDFLGTTNAR
jgi:hypothetical protein